MTAVLYRLKKRKSGKCTRLFIFFFLSANNDVNWSIDWPELPSKWREFRKMWFFFSTIFTLFADTTESSQSLLLKVSETHNAISFSRKEIQLAVRSRKKKFIHKNKRERVRRWCHSNKCRFRRWTRSYTYIRTFFHTHTKHIHARSLCVVNRRLGHANLKLKKNEKKKLTPGTMIMRNTV